MLAPGKCHLTWIELEFAGDAKTMEFCRNTSTTVVRKFMKIICGTYPKTPKDGACALMTTEKFTAHMRKTRVNPVRRNALIAMYRDVYLRRGGDKPLWIIKENVTPVLLRKLFQQYLTQELPEDESTTKETDSESESADFFYDFVLEAENPQQKKRLCTECKRKTSRKPQVSYDVSYIDNLYCVACDQSFSSDRTVMLHVRSPKHARMVNNFDGGAKAKRQRS